MSRKRPFSASMVFMNSRVDLPWGGRFTMKRMEGMKGDDFLKVQSNVYGMGMK